MNTTESYLVIVLVMILTQVAVTACTSVVVLRRKRRTGSMSNLALELLDTLLHAKQCDNQLPLARQLVSALKLDSEHFLSNNGVDKRLNDAILAFEVHPLGDGPTAARYLLCDCAAGKKIKDPKRTQLCESCGRKLRM